MRKTVLVLVAVLFAATWGCAALKSSQDEYKAMIAARPDAELVGNKTCWQCHMNDAHKGAGEGKVSCEDCHGPGSLAVKDLHEEAGRKACNYKTFINIGKLPKQAQSMICMKCHATDAGFVLHNWNTCAHNLSGVSCIDCHNIHHGDNLRLARAQIDELCYGCHMDIKAMFAMPTHHAVPEGKMTCTDCHNPHGSPNPGAMLIRETIKETCTRCHAEKEGPFIYEHADVIEDCTACHMPHGSPNDNLLAERLPYLCKQCHAQHELGGREDVNQFGGNCTNCHSQVHGTDLPSPAASGEGKFLR